MNLTGRRKDGTEFPVEISLSFVPGDDGGLAMAFITDISERVLQERQARHHEKLTALGSLAAGIAHEINNPIGIILSRIELMLMDAEDRQGPSELLDDLRALHRQAGRLNRITDALLKRGYTGEQIRKILGGNLMRAFREAEAVSRSLTAKQRPSLARQMSSSR